jgi:hypothetical protein
LLEAPKALHIQNESQTLSPKSKLTHSQEVSQTEQKQKKVLFFRSRFGVIVREEQKTYGFL